jgi:tRNA pseudouridine38-40 synthase
LNYYLPRDISVNEAYKVNIEFNVQREAISREYQYWIWNRPTRSPLHRDYCHHVIAELNDLAMNEAAQVLLGEHDLASFVTEIKKSVIKSTIRRVFQAQVRRKGDSIIFDIIAQSFLPHQVRNTVGSLIRVGLAKLTADDFKKILEAKKPGLAGPTAPAQGLTLIRVNYPRPLGEYHEDL